MEKSLLKQSFQKAIQSFKVSLPMMFGILLLISLLSTGWQGYYERIFTGNVFLDPLIGALAGSISFGMPIVSYVAAGELLEQGIGLLAATAFILTWTTVGIAMLPLEAKFLGWRFALVRNAVNFIFAIVIAILTVYTI
ncbi:MAG: hypothetical protein U9O20_01960 [Patescibacteria group bacterium]|nr:hypothetical protein [Patescibacteria group bacterium]